MQEVLAPILGVSAVVGVVTVSVIIVRFASVLAKRLEARSLGAVAPNPAVGELRAELDAMQERLDFLERALVAQKNQSVRALPAQGERADPTAHTSS